MNTIYFIIAILTAITLHEAAHAWAAYKLGDPTAKNLGRITLNPIAHLDPLGTILFILINIGWGKPVPVNPNNFKHPQRDNALVALAGPLSNLLTAIALIIINEILVKFSPIIISNTYLNITASLYQMSLLLMVLNLLPIPPLDGSKILGLIIPKKHYYKYQEFMNANLMYVIIVFLIDIHMLPTLAGFSLTQTFLTNGVHYTNLALNQITNLF